MCTYLMLRSTMNGPSILSYHERSRRFIRNSAIYISILYVLAVILLIVYIKYRTIQSLAFMIFFFVYATLELIVSCACLQNYETYGQNDVLVVNNVLPQPAYTNYIGPQMAPYHRPSQTPFSSQQSYKLQ